MEIMISEWFADVRICVVLRLTVEARKSKWDPEPGEHVGKLAPFDGA